MPRRTHLDAAHLEGHIGEVSVAGDLADGELSPIKNRCSVSKPLTRGPTDPAGPRCQHCVDLNLGFSIIPFSKNGYKLWKII
jgi:hypothetical protein